jgi:dihydroorotase
VSQRTAYVNARLLDPVSRLDASGALMTEGASILDFGPRLFNAGRPEGVVTVDCGGKCLAPGVIDMRAFLGEPGGENRETLASASEAAAAGGVTTLVALPHTNPPIDSGALVEFIYRRARETALVNVLPMGAVSKGLEGREMTELGLLAEAGAICFGDGDRAVASARLMRRVLSYATAFDLLITQHVEDPSLAANGAMTEGEMAMRLGLPGIPNAAEVIMVERDLRLVELTGARWHAAGLSTADGVEAIRQAKKRGLKVTCGVAPHHFALNDTAVEQYRTFAKTSPPLRSEDDRKAIVAGLADGTIDVICSNHQPEDTESKRQPFAQAAFGVVGVETMLPVTLELVHNKHLPLLDALYRLTVAPADLLGLKSGRLAKGAPADLVLFDPNTPWLIDANKLSSKSKNSAFDERPVQGRVLRTVVAGRTVYTLPPDA